MQFLENWENFTKILAQYGLAIDFVEEVESHILEWAILRGYAVFEEAINKWIEDRINLRFRDGKEELTFLKKRLQGGKWLSSLKENSLRNVFNVFIGKHYFNIVIEIQDWDTLQSLVDLRHALAHKGAASSPPYIGDVIKYIISSWKVMAIIGAHINQK